MLLAIPTVALTLIPLGFIVVSAISTGADELWRLLVRPRTGELLSNTARLTVATILTAGVIGTAAAWAVERTSLPGRRILHPLLVAPLAVPAFVNSYGWVSLATWAEGFHGALLIVTLSYFPFVYLPVAASLRGLDPALEDVARSLGHGPVRVFARVVLPQLRPALLGGCLLVGLHLLAEFGALQMLRFPTFTTAIYDQYKSTFSGPAASGLATVLAVGCLLLLTIELRARGHRRYARVGSGARRDPERVQLGRATLPVLGAVVALVVLALGVPLGSIVRWLVVGSSTAFPVGDLVSAAGTTALLAALAAATATVVALPIAWLSVRRPGRWSTMIERSTYFGSALPGIVVALALVTVTIRWATPLYQTTAMLVAAYVILFLPRAMVSQRAALAQAPPVLDDVAAALGAGPVARIRRVTLPLIAPGLGAGAALVFLAVVTELTATLLLSPIGTATLATKFWSATTSVAYGAAAPYAALMVVVSIPATLLLTRRTGGATAT
ncbi:Ferric iron ABC transporter permease protein [Patulibacter medicamentivorans]|uniref:Ferric iron ABC transporter permease protein n=1 Tax=Patulibacter medicamentivorans TaxID=1097667 RepID=H0DZR4_9ACTN|nr:iron ABC transporter permease [Patulibacter medicamentivorans]EHN13018.1 Ferric iron ABC transporter permease protein [Patulibacter medicamentivorans]